MLFLSFPPQCVTVWRCGGRTGNMKHGGKNNNTKRRSSFQDCFRRYIDIFFSDLNINVKNTYYDIQFALHHLSMTDVTRSN